MKDYKTYQPYYETLSFSYSELLDLLSDIEDIELGKQELNSQEQKDGIKKAS